MTSQEPGDESPCPALQRSALPPAAPPGVPGPALPPAPPAGGQCPPAPPSSVPSPLRRPRGQAGPQLPQGGLHSSGAPDGMGRGQGGRGQGGGVPAPESGEECGPSSQAQGAPDGDACSPLGEGAPSAFPSGLSPGSQPLPRPGAQGRNLGSPRGDRWLGEGKQVPTAHRGEPTPSPGSWARRGGAGATAPQVSSPPRPRDPQLLPALTNLPQPAGPGRSQGHGGRALAATQKTVLPPAHKQAPPRCPHPTPTARGADPVPGAWCSVPVPGARCLCPVRGAAGRSRSKQRSVARCPPPPWARPRGQRKPREGALGAEAEPEAERPYRAEVSARGTGGAAPAVLSLQEGVHLLTERAQCTAPLQYGNAVPAGAGRAGRPEPRDAGTRRATGCGEGASARRGARPGGSAGRERKRVGARRAGQGVQGGARGPGGEQRKRWRPAGARLRPSWTQKAWGRQGQRQCKPERGSSGTGNRGGDVVGAGQACARSGG